MTKRGRDGGGFDGVRVTARPRRLRRWLIVVVALVAAGSGWWLFQQRGAAAASASMRGNAGEDASGAVQGGGDVGRSAPALSARAAAGGAGDAGFSGSDGEDPTPDLSDYVLPGEAPEMAQVIEALHARGIRTGLGAFSPPGTSPPKQGLEVPADFVLPEGYVRHHQVTDDGQPIAPILMFAPDLDFVVKNGVRVPVPPDRVVPPELAPPGLPPRRVRIPPPLDAGGGP